VPAQVWPLIHRCHHRRFLLKVARVTGGAGAPGSTRLGGASGGWYSTSRRSNHAIQRQRSRYRIDDQAALAEALGVEVAGLAELQRDWVETALRAGRRGRDERWSEGVAAGSRGLAEQVQRDRGVRGWYRTIDREGEAHLLRAASESYGLDFPGETASTRRESAWTEACFPVISMNCRGATPGDPG